MKSAAVTNGPGPRPGRGSLPTPPPQSPGVPPQGAPGGSTGRPPGCRGLPRQQLDFGPIPPNSPRRAGTACGFHSTRAASGQPPINPTPGTLSPAPAPGLSSPRDLGRRAPLGVVKSSPTLLPSANFYGALALCQAPEPKKE